MHSSSILFFVAGAAAVAVLGASSGQSLGSTGAPRRASPVSKGFPVQSAETRAARSSQLDPASADFRSDFLERLEQAAMAATATVRLEDAMFTHVGQELVICGAPATANESVAARVGAVSTRRADVLADAGAVSGAGPEASEVVGFVAISWTEGAATPAPGALAQLIGGRIPEGVFQLCVDEVSNRIELKDTAGQVVSSYPLLGVDSRGNPTAAHNSISAGDASLALQRSQGNIRESASSPALQGDDSWKNAYISLVMAGCHR